MAGLKEFYSVNDKPSTAADVLPAAEYVVKVVGGEMKDTKNRDGQYLEVDMEVVEGDYTGSVIRDRFNLKNKSDEAVRIAKSQFAALREATGVLEPEDIADFRGIRFRVVLRLEKWQDDPPRWSNRVQRYLKNDGSSATPAQTNSPKPGGDVEDAPPW